MRLEIKTKSITVILNCKVCKKEFRVKFSHFLNGRRKCCSMKCRNKSKEWRDNLSRVGKLAWKEGRKKAPLGSTHKGWHHTKEIKQLLRKQRIGISTGRTKENGFGLSEEHKRKISMGLKKSKKRRVGKEHSSWRGGKSNLPYSFDFNEELKELIRKRDNYKCQICGAPQRECITKLPVHHIDYDKLNSNPNNLITLCPSCHNKTNNANREYWTNYFEEKIKC